MFKFLIVAVLGFSLNASAAGKWKLVEESRVPLFKQALTEAINAKKLDCNGTVTERGSTRETSLSFAAVSRTVNNAQELWLNEDLSQPIIYVKVENSNYRVALHFTTTADRKGITKIDIRQIRFEIQHRNIGTIDDPAYAVTEVVTQEIIGNCQ